MSIANIVREARANPPKTDGLSVDEIKAAIAAITDDLRRPGIRHAERLALNEDRHAFRRALAAREPSP